MLLTLTTQMPQATDLGHLLHKHPDRVQRTATSGGTAWVFYPEAGENLCTAALLVEIEGDRLRPSGDDFPLSAYVSDARWAAGSLMAVAIKSVFGTAMTGRCRSRPELAATEIPLTISLPVVRSTDPSLPQRLFGPLGWEVAAIPLPADPTRPQWGNSAYCALTLTGQRRLSEALRALYVMLPVLADVKHYWVGELEVDKLLLAGEGWLGTHPERNLIIARYLAHQRRYQRDALDRLTGAQDRPEEDRPRPLAVLRRAAVIDHLRRVAATSVVDIGCGDGTLLAELRAEPTVNRLLGVDVSMRALRRAQSVLHLDSAPERPRVSVELAQSSVTYADPRLAGHDAAVLMEVIEHLEPGRLESLVHNVFALARPTTVLVTTPNAEYNVRYPALTGMRHPDHRFEWTRAQFRDWAADVAARTGYRVAFDDIGDVDPVLGSPTQLAVFTR